MDARTFFAFPMMRHVLRVEKYLVSPARRRFLLQSLSVSEYSPPSLTTLWPCVSISIFAGLLYNHLCRSLVAAHLIALVIAFVNPLSLSCSLLLSRSSRTTLMLACLTCESTNEHIHYAVPVFSSFLSTSLHLSHMLSCLALDASVYSTLSSLCPLLSSSFFLFPSPSIQISTRAIEQCSFLSHSTCHLFYSYHFILFALFSISFNSLLQRVTTLDSATRPPALHVFFFTECSGVHTRVSPPHPLPISGRVLTRTHISHSCYLCSFAKCHCILFCLQNSWRRQHIEHSERSERSERSEK